jgi:hypothetical protein
MCTTGTYIGFYNLSKFKKLQADIVKAEIELEQAKLSPTSNKDLILHLTEYLADRQSKFYS